jgi:hypothetical protein
MLAFAIGVGLPAAASAQETMAAVTYTISLPGSNTKAFIDETSFRGVQVVARTAPWPGKPILLGVTLGWEIFSFETDEPIQLETATISGRQRRYLNAVPLLATAHYYLGNKESWRVFMGLGVGTIYTLQTFEIGVYSFEHGTWQLGLVPEVGVQIPVRNRTDLYLAGHYDYSFEDGESLTREAVAWDYWSLDVGFAWRGW